MNIERKPEPSAQWMVSFADLLSLILTFFVLIFSMANPMQMTNIFKNEFNSIIQNKSDITFSEIEMEVDVNTISSDYLENIFQNKIEQDPALKSLGIKSIEGKFYLSLPFTAFTDDKITKIAEFIRPFENEKYVYSSNMEMSKVIAEQLRELGVTDGLGFYEKEGLQDKIDIIIYP